MKSREREAMGGLMKGHPHGNNGGGSRGRLYGLMLLLAFGVAVIGVMLLHRFRERRFFNLLVKEKDSELTSLHLLLQKERDNAKEAKWKLEAMKAKIHTLRAQKRELDNRISEMHSTISSLKEEQNTIELTLEEKQDEIKLLRGKRTGINSESSQIQALSDILKQKESEIEDLNHRLESPVKVWSVSSDDPSNASVDLHRKTRMPERDESNANEGEQSAAKLNDSISHEIRGYSIDHADSSRRESANNQSDGHERQHNNKGENGGETVESREIVGEESQKAGNSKDSSLEHGNKDIEERTAEGAKKNSDESQKEWQEKDTMKMGAFDNSDSEAQRHQDEGRHTTEKKVLETTGDGLSEKTSNAQGGENQEFGRNYIGGMKSEILRNSHIRQYLKGNHGNLKRAKEKRRSTLARIMENRGNYESNGLAVRRDRVSFESTLPRDGQPQTLDSDQHDRKSFSVTRQSVLEDPGMKASDTLQEGTGSKLIINEQDGLEHDEVQADVVGNEVPNNTENKKDSSEGSGLPLAKHEGSKDLKQEDRKNTIHPQLEEKEGLNDTNTSTALNHISQKEETTNMSLKNDDTKKSLQARPQDQYEPRESEHQTTSIQPLTERISGQNEDKLSEQTKTAEIDEGTSNPEMLDLEEKESETETSTESMSDSQADSEDYKEKSSEPEF